MIQFSNPFILLLLWSVPVIIWLWIFLRKRSEIKLKQFISGAMQATLRFPTPKYKLIMQIVFIAIGLSLLILSVAGPFDGYRKETITDYHHDIVILLDVSSSMLAKDAQPNRQENAKSTILELVSQLPQDRLALMAFRHDTTLLSPLTFDHNFLSQSIKLASLGSASAGESDIGSAISTATKLFKNDSKTDKIILLFSDGEDLTGNIKQGIVTAAENNITIFTVGIGATDKITIPDPLQPDKPYIYNGKTVLTSLNEQTLKTIAESTGGEYVPAYKDYISPSDMCTEYLRRIKKEETSNTMRKLRIYCYNWFLLPAFIFMFLAALLSIQSKPHIHKKASKILLLFVALTILTLITSISQAGKLTADELAFNSAAALFTDGKYEQAIATLNKTESEDEKYIMAYGCTYFKAAQKLNDTLTQLPKKIKLYKQAAESFRTILKQQGNNQTAIHNLTVSYLAVQASANKLAKLKPPKKTSNKTIKTVKNDTISSKTETQNKEKSTEANELSNAEIDKLLSKILSHEKEYQTKKQQYGKLIPLRADVKDW